MSNSEPVKPKIPVAPIRPRPIWVRARRRWFSRRESKLSPAGAEPARAQRAIDELQAACPACGHSLAEHGAGSLDLDGKRAGWCCADRACHCDRYPAEKLKLISLERLDRLLVAAGQHLPGEPRIP